MNMEPNSISGILTEIRKHGKSGFEGNWELKMLHCTMRLFYQMSNNHSGEN